MDAVDQLKGDGSALKLGNLTMDGEIVTGSLIAAESGRVVGDILQRTGYLITIDLDVGLEIVNILAPEIDLGIYVGING